MAGQRKRAVCYGDAFIDVTPGQLRLMRVVSHSPHPDPQNVEVMIFRAGSAPLRAEVNLKHRANTLCFLRNYEAPSDEASPMTWTPPVRSLRAVASSAFTRPRLDRTHDLSPLRADAPTPKWPSNSPAMGCRRPTRLAQPSGVPPPSLSEREFEATYSRRLLLLSNDAVYPAALGANALRKLPQRVVQLLLVVGRENNSRRLVTIPIETPTERQQRYLIDWNAPRTKVTVQSVIEHQMSQDAAVVVAYCRKATGDTSRWSALTPAVVDACLEARDQLLLPRDQRDWSPGSLLLVRPEQAARRLEHVGDMTDPFYEQRLSLTTGTPLSRAEYSL